MQSQDKHIDNTIPKNVSFYILDEVKILFYFLCYGVVTSGTFPL